MYVCELHPIIFMFLLLFVNLAPAENISIVSAPAASRHRGRPPPLSLIVFQHGIGVVLFMNHTQHLLIAIRQLLFRIVPAGQLGTFGLRAINKCPLIACHAAHIIA